MTDDQIKVAFENLNRHKDALYKPLLLLFMLGQYWHDRPRLLKFRKINEPVQDLFGMFDTKKPHRDSALWPFWHMQNETAEIAIWELTGAEELTPQEANWSNRPNFIEAYNSDLRGGFTENLYQRIINDKEFLLVLAVTVLRRYFPKYPHVDLLESVGIPEQTQPAHLASFINKVLQIYQYRCAVCEFTGELDNINIGVQVAHIKWPLAGGPDDCDNGLALCNPHRELFDVGAFTLLKGNVVSVSSKYTERGGTHLFDDYEGRENALSRLQTHRPRAEYPRWYNLNDYEGREIATPNLRLHRPRAEYLRWHNEQVFR